MTKGSGDARTQSVFFLITTAGTDRRSVYFEQHQTAEDILMGRKIDPTFYPVIYGVLDDTDWSVEKIWYQANLSLGHTIDIEKVRNAFLSAKDNPAEENIFRLLLLNQWVKQSTRWMQMEKWDACGFPVNEQDLMGREEKSTEKIDRAVAMVMALDRAIQNGNNSGSVYDDRGYWCFKIGEFMLY